MTEVRALTSGGVAMGADLLEQAIDQSPDFFNMLRRSLGTDVQNKELTLALTEALMERGLGATNLENILLAAKRADVTDPKTFADAIAQINAQPIRDAIKNGELAKFRSYLQEGGYLDLHKFRNSLTSLAISTSNVKEFTEITQAFKKFSDEIMTADGTLKNLNLENVENRLVSIDKLKQERQRLVAVSDAEQIKNLDEQIDANLQLLKDDISAMANDDNLYRSLSEKSGIPISTYKRYMDKSFWGKISDTTSYLAKNSPNGGSGQRTWFHTFRDIGIASMILWVLSAIGIDDYLIDALKKFLKEVIGLAGEIAEEAAGAAGGSLWELLKPFLIPLGVVCCIVFIIIIFFISKGGNPKDLVK